MFSINFNSIKIAGLVLIASSSIFAQSWDAPTLADFKPHKLSGKNYTEAWSYSFYFDNGTKAYVTYSLNKLPMSGKVFGGELSFQNFKGKNKSVSREYPYKRFAWKEELKGLELTGKGTRMALEGLPGKGHRVDFTTAKNGGFLLDVTFTKAVQGKVFNKGEQEVKGANFGQIIHIPEGRVKGKIAIGKDTIAVGGYAVLEHTWQNKLVSDLFAHTLQVFKPNQYSAKVYITEKDHGQDVKGYGVVKTVDGYKFEFFSEFLSDSKPMKASSSIPKNISLKLGEETIEFVRNKDQQVYSPLDNIDGWLARKAVKIALGEVKVRRGTSKGTHYSIMEK